MSRVDGLLVMLDELNASCRQVFTDGRRAGCGVRPGRGLEPVGRVEASARIAAIGDGTRPTRELERAERRCHAEMADAGGSRCRRAPRARWGAGATADAERSRPDC